MVEHVGQDLTLDREPHTALRTVALRRLVDFGGHRLAKRHEGHLKEGVLIVEVAVGPQLARVWPRGVENGRVEYAEVCPARFQCVEGEWGELTSLIDRQTEWPYGHKQGGVLARAKAVPSRSRNHPQVRATIGAVGEYHAATITSPHRLVHRYLHFALCDLEAFCGNGDQLHRRHAPRTAARPAVAVGLEHRGASRLEFDAATVTAGSHVDDLGRHRRIYRS